MKGEMKPKNGKGGKNKEAKKAKKLVEAKQGGSESNETPKGPVEPVSATKLEQNEYPNPAPETKVDPRVSKLMEIFDLKEDKRARVTEFVKTFSPNAQLSELTNLFIDQVLPSLNQK